MKIIKKHWTKLVLVIYAFFVPIIVLWADTSTSGCDPSTQICNPINANSIQDLINTVLRGMIQVGLPVIALAIVYSGFLFVFARGNSEKLTKAKSALVYTLIGAAILMGAIAIAEMVKVTVSGF